MIFWKIIELLAMYLAGLFTLPAFVFFIWTPRQVEKSRKKLEQAGALEPPSDEENDR
ncbi:MAG TPA: hypothetical protein VGM77_11230 [Gemmatimonadales bacterium]|jgi:hypothetical protein